MWGGRERKAEAGPSAPLKGASLRMTGFVEGEGREAEAGPSAPLKGASLRMTAFEGGEEREAEAGPSAPLKGASLRMTGFWVGKERKADAAPSASCASLRSLRMTTFVQAAWKAEKQPLRPAFSSLSSLGRIVRCRTAGKVWGNPLMEGMVTGLPVMRAWRSRYSSSEAGRSGRSMGRKTAHSALVEARAAQMPLRGPWSRLVSSISGAKAARAGWPPAMEAGRFASRRMRRAWAMSG